jgi:hypothetical protein
MKFKTLDVKCYARIGTRNEKTEHNRQSAHCYVACKTIWPYPQLLTALLSKVYGSIHVKVYAQKEGARNMAVNKEQKLSFHGSARRYTY